MTTNDFVILCLCLGIIPGLTLMTFGLLTKKGMLFKKNADRLYSIIVYGVMIISGLVMIYYNSK